jgi:hypothetical protein
MSVWSFTEITLYLNTVLVLFAAADSCCRHRLHRHRCCERPLVKVAVLDIVVRVRGTVLDIDSRSLAL